MLRATAVDIRFVSALTPDEEASIAPALLKLLTGLLDVLPLSYVLRIETSNGTSVQATKLPERQRQKSPRTVFDSSTDEDAL